MKKTRNLSRGKQVKLLLFLLWLHFDEKLTFIRPRDVIIPITLAQMIVFVFAAYVPSTKSFVFGVIANLVITAIALVPSLKHDLLSMGNVK